MTVLFGKINKSNILMKDYTLKHEIKKKINIVLHLKQVENV